MSLNQCDKIKFYLRHAKSEKYGYNFQICSCYDNPFFPIFCFNASAIS
jgi:hypothetical protein